MAGALCACMRGNSEYLEGRYGACKLGECYPCMLSDLLLLSRGKLLRLYKRSVLSWVCKLLLPALFVYCHNPLYEKDRFAKILGNLV